MQNLSGRMVKQQWRSGKAVEPLFPAFGSFSDLRHRNFGLFETWTLVIVGEHGETHPRPRVVVE